MNFTIAGMALMLMCACGVKTRLIPPLDKSSNHPVEEEKQTIFYFKEIVTKYECTET